MNCKYSRRLFLVPSSMVLLVMIGVGCDQSQPPPPPPRPVPTVPNVQFIFLPDEMLPSTPTVEVDSQDEGQIQLDLEGIDSTRRKQLEDIAHPQILRDFQSGVENLALERHESALSDFGQVVIKNKMNERVIATIKSDEAYNNRAVAWARLGYIDKALGDLAKAIENNPKLGIAYFNRGYLHEYRGDNKSATSDFTMAADLGVDDTQRAVLYHDLGVYQNSLEGHEKSTACFDAALKLNSEFASAHYHRGKARELSGDGDGAEADFAAAKALGFEPSD